MFDIGFSELLLIAVVALVVLGPERLPKVARTLGHLFGRAQRYVSDIKSDINRELALDELRKTQAKMEAAVSEVQYEMTDEVKKTEEVIQQAVEDAKASPEPGHTETGALIAPSVSPQLELGLEQAPKLPESKA
jgi:sec-independent protein translocase protein TatB